MSPLPLRYDPYAIFRSSRTPPGLYARQKWLKEASTARWQSDFASTVSALYRDQSGDGLWNNSPLETISRLFGLHLTVRNPDRQIQISLDRLLEVASDAAMSAPKDPQVSAEQLVGLPFAPSRWHAFVVPATLFLASIFGKATDPSVLALYKGMASRMTEAGMANHQAGEVHNILRALVVHADYAGHHATRSTVAWLADRQSLDGDWGGSVPFYQAVNALAHLNSSESEGQCEKAFGRLVRSQNPDGTWGETDKEWCTFLAVHALRNKGMI